VVRWFADFRMEYMSAKSCIAWWEKDEVYDGVGIMWVIYEPSGAGVKGGRQFEA